MSSRTLTDTAVHLGGVEGRVFATAPVCAAVWLRLKQTGLIPGKGSSASVCRNRLSYPCPTTILRDPRNPHRHHLSATLLDGRAPVLSPATAKLRGMRSACSEFCAGHFFSQSGLYRSVAVAP
jgi:hypothetical protein